MVEFEVSIMVDTMKTNWGPFNSFSVHDVTKRVRFQNFEKKRLKKRLFLP